MTREEAIQIMSTWLVSSKGSKGQQGYIEGWFDEEDAEAFRMAIDALSAESVQTIRHIENNTKESNLVYRPSRPSADAVQGYIEWLEKIIVDNEGANEWLCEDTPDPEWCEENCHYSSIQAKCLRHIYGVIKGGKKE